MCTQISQAKQEAAVAKEVATEALAAATLAQNRSETSVQQSSDLIKRLQHFLEVDGATSQQIQTVAQEVFINGYTKIQIQTFFKIFCVYS